MSAEADQEARYKLAAALAGGASKAAAAKAAGYARPHVYRLLQEPEFQRMLEAARVRLAGEGASGAAVSADDVRASIEYLRSVVDGDDEDAEPRDRIAAAKALLSAAAVVKRKPEKAPTPEVRPAARPPVSAAEAGAKWSPKLA
jgi:hypothetical protein